jgi:hypothetical protein
MYVCGTDLHARVVQVSASTVSHCCGSIISALYLRCGRSVMRHHQLMSLTAHMSLPYILFAVVNCCKSAFLEVPGCPTEAAFLAQAGSLELGIELGGCAQAGAGFAAAARREGLVLHIELNGSSSSSDMSSGSSSSDTYSGSAAGYAMAVVGEQQYQQNAFDCKLEQDSAAQGKC